MNAAGLFDAGELARSIIIRVAGVPVPQGSKNAIPLRRRDGSPIVNARGRQIVNQVESNAAALAVWRARLVFEAQAGMRGIQPFAGAVKIGAVFTFERPVSHRRTGRNAHLLRDAAPARPTGKPDLDKLIRAVGDALTIAEVWRDDAQVVEFGRCAKVYAGEDPDAFAVAGALLRVCAVT